jgi:hypothetical protein
LRKFFKNLIKETFSIRKVSISINKRDTNIISTRITTTTRDKVRSTNIKCSAELRKF